MKSNAIRTKDKHIDVSYRYVRDMVERGQSKVDYIPSKKMIVDLMTKGLLLETFTRPIESMG